MRVLGSAVVEEEITSRDISYTIQPKCEGNRGKWLCVNHDEIFDNNMQKDGHTREGTHVLAWWCAEHGPEVP